MPNKAVVTQGLRSVFESTPKAGTISFFHFPVTQTIAASREEGVRQAPACVGNQMFLFFICVLLARGEKKKGGETIWSYVHTRNNTIVINWGNDEILELLSEAPGPNTPWCTVLICPAQMANWRGTSFRVNAVNWLAARGRTSPLPPVWVWDPQNANIMAGLLVPEPKPIAACCSSDLKDNRELIMQSRCGVCHQDKYVW